MELPVELRERLIAVRGELLWGRLSGSVVDAGWLACDLIGAGVDTPAMLDLAGHTLSIGSMAEIEPLVRLVLSECDMPAVDTQREPWVVAHEVAHAVAAGTLPLSAGTDFLIMEFMEKCDYPREITELMMLIDDWEAIRTTPPTDEEIRFQAGKIAAAAHGRLADDHR